MDMTNFAQLIGTLGFPIVACCSVFFALYKVVMYLLQSKDDVIKNNTAAMVTLAEKIDNLVNK